jgi:hypothetical protein
VSYYWLCRRPAIIFQQRAVSQIALPRQLELPKTEVHLPLRGYLRLPKFTLSLCLWNPEDIGLSAVGDPGLTNGSSSRLRAFAAGATAVTW